MDSIVMIEQVPRKGLRRRKLVVCMDMPHAEWKQCSFKAHFIELKRLRRYYLLTYMIVYKFGGATTRSVRGLERMAMLVRRAYDEGQRRRSGRGLVVVVSAIGHTTRRLRSIAEDAESGRSLFAGETLERIVERHIQLADSLELGDEVYRQVIENIRKIAADTAKLVEGVAITRELSERTLD